jgi:hypothetical protein
MCLIIATKTGRPTEEYIRNGFANHPHGTGVAWHEGGEVHYKKNLTLEESIKLAAELPMGYVMHFRWASVGGPDKSLVHPFPIAKDVPLLEEGKAKSVLFQNGHWDQWNNVLVNHLSSRVTLPRGKWSDTRAIAFLVSVHGSGILKLIESAGRFVVMVKDKNYGFGSFIEENGVAYSNDTFRRVTRGCGTGITKTTTHGTPYSPVITPSTPQTRPQISPPSNGWVGTPRSPQSLVPNTEREILTEAEYNELQQFFEKDLAGSRATSTVTTGGS